jgi:hypothetical protein
MDCALTVVVAEHVLEERGMAFTVKPDGSIEVSTLEEAIALSKRLAAEKVELTGGTRAPEAASAAVLPPPPSPPRQQTLTADWPFFVVMLGTNQQRLLRALQEERTAFLEDLWGRVGVENNQGVTGVISGIIKNAKKRNLDPELLLRRVPDPKGRPMYTAGPVLLNAPPIMVKFADDEPDHEEVDTMS